MNLGRIFILWSVLVCILAMAALVVSVNRIMEREIRALYEQNADMVLSSMHAVRSHVRSVVRPEATRFIGTDEFVVELQSTSYAANKIFEAIPDDRKYEIQFRTASTKPMNPKNKATPVEEELIELLDQMHLAGERELEWRGVREVNGMNYFVVALGEANTRGCIPCHSAPEDAPLSMQRRYSFDSPARLENRVETAEIVFIPMSSIYATIASANRDLLALGAVGLAAIVVAVHLLFSRLISSPLGRLRKYALDVEQGKPDVEIRGTFRGELASLKATVQQMARNLAGSIQRLSNELTERKQAEATLFESRSKMQAITESAHDAIIMMGPDGEISFWNPTAESIFGYAAEEVMGKNLHHLLVPERYQEAYEKVFPEFQRTGRGKAVGKTIELTAIGKDGGEIPISLSLSSVSLQDKWHAVGIVRDVTEIRLAAMEREKLQAQLVQAQKMESVGVLAGGVAHDFNNLLMAMRGNLELLAGTESFAPGNANRIQTVIASLDRAAKLVQQLLLFSRKAEPGKERVDLTQEVHEAARILERTIPKMVALELRLAPDVWPISGDPAQVEQILLNLANNAVDAMPEGGRLIIETGNMELDQDFVRLHLGSSTGRHALLTVTDTGSGMDEATLKHIFDPFFTTKEIGKGTGLGLASAYGIVKAHGGFILCYSEPGQGTVFRVFLPAVDKIEVATEELKPRAVLSGGNETIMVVDDEPAILNLTQEALEIIGYSVKSAANGEEALLIYQRHGHDIDLVLLDLNMPGMGGVKCLQELLRLNPEVKVVIASGYSANGQASHSLTSGTKGFIGKPYRLQELAAMVRKVLGDTENPG